MLKNSTHNLPEPKLVGRFWIWPDGTVLPVVSGAADGDDEDEGDDQGDKRTYGQKDVDSIVAEVKRNAKASAEKEMKKLLGVEDLGEVKSLLEQHRQNQDKNKTDLEKAQGELTKFQDEAKALKVTVANLDLTHRIEKALISEGLSVPAAERARKLVELQADASAEDIKAEIAELKKTMPSLFSNQEGEGEGKPTHSSPGRPPKKEGQGSSSGTDAARSLLHQRHPNLKKS